MGMQCSECSADYNLKVTETVDLIKSLHCKKKIITMDGDEADLLSWSFLNVYKHQIVMLYI